MSQQHFHPREQPRPVSLSGTWLEALAAVSAFAALVAVCLALLHWLGPDWPGGLIWFLFASVAWLAVSNLAPRLAVLLRRARRRGRELLIRTGPLTRRVDLGRISRIFDRGRVLEFHTQRGALLIRKDRLAGSPAGLIGHWRRLRAGSGVRPLSPPVKALVGRIDLLDLALAAVLWAATVAGAAWTGSAGAALWVLLGGAFVLLFWAWMSGRPRLTWMTPKVACVYGGGRTREFDLRQVEWFGWRSIRGGAVVELHEAGGRMSLRCHEADAALLCNMIQWRSPAAPQVDLDAGQAYPGPRMRPAPAALAQRIVARVRSRDRKTLLVGLVVVLFLALAGGLQTLCGWSEPDSRWTTLAYGFVWLAVALAGIVGLIHQWAVMRKRWAGINDSVAEAMEAPGADGRIHALTDED